MNGAARRTSVGESWRRWLNGVGGPARRPGGRSRQQQQTIFFTLAAFGLVLGLALGAILAVPLSATAAIVKGQPSPVDLVAPNSLTYESEAQTRREQEAAAKNPSNTRYIIDRDLPQEQGAELRRTLDEITDILSDDGRSTQERANAIATLPTLAISPTLALAASELRQDEWLQVEAEARRIYDEFWQEHANGVTASELQRSRERELPYMRLSPTLGDQQRELVTHFVSAFIQPNRSIDQEATDLLRAAAREAVQPVQVTVLKNETIVRKGDLVNDVAYEKLSKLGLVFGAGGWVAIFQKWLLGMLAGWLFATYLYRFQSNLAANRRALGVIGGLMAAIVLAGRLLVPVWNGVPYAFPLAAVAILLTVLFDGRVGLFAAFTVAPLIGLQSDKSIGLTFTMLLGSAAGVFLAQRAIRSISFVWVALGVALATSLSALGFWLDPVNGWPASLRIVLFSVLNGAGASILALGTYHILGRLADVVTPLQLMELAHPNHPLLHRLMREAPGTYHHSIVVSNLAEVAAEDIGADPLLARVGAYYHDVGKILRPYFFTDNQHERSNVHDNLDAKTSAAIIIDHVREGAKLAREHRLPQQVVDFIPQHHGTNLVSFFYQRALQEDSDANIDDFRYPGPKPQTREAGIMMLADGVEATVRARAQSGKLRPSRPDEENVVAERGFQSIAEVVDQIVSERVRSGQLDECPLTLRDIAIIKQSFVKTLQGIYHPRVDYVQPTAPQPVPEMAR